MQLTKKLYRKLDCRYYDPKYSIRIPKGFPPRVPPRVPPGVPAREVLRGKKGLIFSGQYLTKSATVRRCPQRPPRLPLAVPFSISRFHARSLCKCATTRNALLSVLKKTARPLKSGRLYKFFGKKTPII